MHAATEPPGQRATAERGAPRRLAFLEAVIDASGDAVFGIDADGLVMSWNRGAERIFGWSADEVVGEPVIALFPVQAHDTVQWFLGVVASGDRIERFELDVERKGGMPTPIALSLCPVIDPNGAVSGVAAVAHDLTERRLAQATLAETEARLQEGEALAHVGRWLWDVGSGAVQWSEQVHHIHGVDPWEFGGDLKAHVSCIVPDDRDRVIEALQQAVADGRPFEEEYAIVRPDGDTHRLYSRAEPTMGANGVVVGLRGIVHDPSARRRAT
jgi:PAS domain S-box-containing protein